MTKSNTAPILSKLADCLRIGGGPFSGAGQYAALVAMYPFITYFSLFDFVPEVAQPQVFEIVAQAAGGSEGAQAMAERTAYQVNAILAFFFLDTFCGALIMICAKEMNQRKEYAHVQKMVQPRGSYSPYITVPEREATRRMRS